MSTKGWAGCLLFCLDLELFAKIKKTWFLHTHEIQVFTFLLLNEDVKKTKNCKHSDIVMEETSAKF